jgi:hypothetical protein
VTLSIIIQSCVPVYVANNVNTPQFKEAGEIQIGGYYGTNGIEFQLAGSLTDYIALIGNGSFASRGGEGEDLHKHNFIEGGLGWFTTIGESGCFDLFGGYGAGDAESQTVFESSFDSNHYLKAHGDFSRIFFQSSIGVSHKGADRKPDFAYGIAVRYSIVEFTNFIGSNENAMAVQNNFIEPVLFTSLGKKHVHVKFQWGLVTAVKHRSELPFDYEPMWLSIGLNLQFGGTDTE